MLVMTSNSLPSVRDISPPMDWHGARVLALHPPSGLDQAQIHALEQDYFVIEFLDQTPGAAAVLGDVARWLGHLLQGLEGPLLYINAPMDAFDLELQVAEAKASPDRIRADLSDDGQLKLLRLGEIVATSPLLPEFFRMIAGRAMTDGLFVDLLTEAFVWDKV